MTVDREREGEGPKGAGGRTPSDAESLPTLRLPPVEARALHRAAAAARGAPRLPPPPVVPLPERTVVRRAPGVPDAAGVTAASEASGARAVTAEDDAFSAAIGALPVPGVAEASGAQARSEASGAKASSEASGAKARSEASGAKARSEASGVRSSARAGERIPAPPMPASMPVRPTATAPSEAPAPSTATRDGSPTLRLPAVTRADVEAAPERPRSLRFGGPRRVTRPALPLPEVLRHGPRTVAAGVRASKPELADEPAPAITTTPARDVADLDTADLVAEVVDELAAPAPLASKGAESSKTAAAPLFAPPQQDAIAGVRPVVSSPSVATASDDILTLPHRVARTPLLQRRGTRGAIALAAIAIVGAALWLARSPASPPASPPTAPAVARSNDTGFALAGMDADRSSAPATALQRGDAATPTPRAQAMPAEPTRPVVEPPPPIEPPPALAPAPSPEAPREPTSVEVPAVAAAPEPEVVVEDDPPQAAAAPAEPAPAPARASKRGSSKRSSGKGKPSKRRPSASTPAPAPAAAPATTAAPPSDASALLAEAQKAYAAGRYGAALSACALGNADAAQRAFTKVPLGQGMSLRNACRDRGVRLAI